MTGFIHQTEAKPVLDTGMIVAVSIHVINPASGFYQKDES
jgi:hypothetical protein